MPVAFVPAFVAASLHGFREFVGKLFSAADRPQADPPAGGRNVSARYDAAQTSDENLNHWGAADGLSANAANNYAVRRVLRNRSRYECANNSWACGIVRTLTDHTTGTGPRLQLDCGDPDASRGIAKSFRKWMKRIGLPEKLRTLKSTQIRDGEGFALFITNPKVRHPVKLDIRLMEADQVTTPNLIGYLPYQIDGIKYDENWNPLEYHVVKHHPGDILTTFVWAYDTYSADQMLHLFRAERPGQGRGIPELMAALPLFALLRRYVLAEINAAEAAALYSAILKTNGSAVDPATIAAWTAVPLQRNAMVALPDGWDMSQMDPSHPISTFNIVVETILNEIARCLNMPLNMAMGNSSGFNFSSGRLDHLTYFRSVQIDQDHIARTIMDRIFFAWLEEAMLIPGLIPDGLPAFDDWEIDWHWDQPEMIDPSNESAATTERLSNGTSSYQREIAKDGLDWETVQNEQATALGLTIDEYRAKLVERLFAAKTPAPAAPAPDDQGGGKPTDPNDDPSQGRPRSAAQSRQQKEAASNAA